MGNKSLSDRYYLDAGLIRNLLHHVESGTARRRLWENALQRMDTVTYLNEKYCDRYYT